VREVTVQTTISAPREEVYDFVADLAGRPAYTDHFLEDFRLARANPVGKGAAARFKVRGQWAELAIRDADRPRRIVEEARIGRLGRNRALAVYELIPEAGGTRVELTTYSEPKTAIDRLRQRGAHRWIKRQTRIALRRLRQIFEEPPKGELARATVAGYESRTAPRFGAHVPVAEKSDG
jgi:uncharacterized protein YndB with AHSA1/START domain